MYLQTLMLALTQWGGTCVKVSVAGYPDVVRAELKIPPELTIIGRDLVEKNVVFVEN